MKKKIFLFLLVLAALFLIAGCGEQSTSSEDSAASTNTDTAAKTASASDTETEISKLKNSPGDYCMTYINEVPGLPPELNSEVEYCIKGDDQRSKVSLAGFETTSYCLDGGAKNVVCSAGNCADDSNACSPDKVPFASVTSTDMKDYKKAPGRQIAGLDAKCYTLDIRDLQGVEDAGLGDDYYIVEICYHPEFKHILYHSGAGTKTYVKSFLTPAPEEKFEMS